MRIFIAICLWAMVFYAKAQIQVLNDITCHGDSTGALIAVPVGGIPPHTFLWNTGAVTPAIHDLVTGNYSVTITDAAAATTVLNYFLSEPALIQISTTGITPSTCDGFNNGAADITVSGGVPVYTYQWLHLVSDSVYTTQDISNVRGGAYRIEATDSWGCMVADTITIPNTDTIPYITTLEDYVCNGLRGNVSVTATEATAGYYFTYEWSTPFESGLFNTTDLLFTGSVALIAGTYTISVTDQQTLCQAYYDFTINQSETPMVVAETIVHNPCDDDMFGTISLELTGGDPHPTYHVSWTGPAGYSMADATTISGLACGDYQYTATDDSACVTHATVTIQSINGDCFTLPNLVTPNGDGYNDTYFVEGACNYTGFFMQIYDSWGKLIFETTDCAAAWDPLADDAQPNSVYYYLIRLDDGTLEKEYKSSIDIKF